MNADRWRDPASRRGALLRFALFAVLYSALNYLLVVGFSGLTGRLDGPAVFLVTAATLLAAMIAGGALLSALDHRSVGALGFAWTRQTPRQIVVGVGIGAAGLAVAALAMALAGALQYEQAAGTPAGWAATMVAHLGIFGVAAAAEEAVYRGYGFQVLVRGFGAIPALLGTSALFAIAHAANPNITGFALLNIFLAGVLLGLAYLRTMSLWFATAVHVGWNWAMASLFDLPVSGLAMFDAPLYEPAIGGAAWFSGGSFGPEGGIVGTLGFAVAFMIMLLLVRLRVSPEMAALRPVALGAGVKELIDE